MTDVFTVWWFCLQACSPSRMILFHLRLWARTTTCSWTQPAEGWWASIHWWLRDIRSLLLGTAEKRIQCWQHKGRTSGCSVWNRGAQTWKNQPFSKCTSNVEIGHKVQWGPEQTMKPREKGWGGGAPSPTGTPFEEALGGTVEWRGFRREVLSLYSYSDGAGCLRTLE